jgi:putative endonuclease
MNKRLVGTEYESKAADFLKSKGYVILERNYRCRTGEIDIIAREGRTLCFVEVKYRSGRGCGSPLEAVDYHKQKKILGVARYYMMKKGLPGDTDCRMDVVAIEGDEISVLRNAFGE